MKSIYVNQFDGGMASDPRDPHENVQRGIKHFDNYTDTYKLTPYRDMIKDAVTESGLDNFRIQNMVIGNNTLYGVGVVSNVDAHTQVYTKVSASDPTSVWTTAPATSTSGSSVESNTGAVFYHNFIYGVNSSGIWQYGNVTSSPSFVYNKYTTKIPNAQGLVHSKDDIMYWPSNNLILSMNDTAGDGSASFGIALTLPINSTIRSICEYGNYLAIACDQPDSTCVVYLWDRNTSLTTLSEKLDWSVGSMKHIETIGGVLCGVSVSSINSTSLTPHLLFKYYDGASRIVTFQEYVCSLITFPGSPTKQKFGNIFYFLAEITIDSVAYKGLWKIYKNSSGHMAVSFDILPRNDTTLDAASLKNFIRWGDYVFISYLVPTTGLYTIWRTDDQALYTATSVYETCVNPQMPVSDRSQKKKLMSIGATYEALPTAGQVVMKYRVDGGAWTTVFTETTDSQVRTEPFPIGALGTEFEFHIESTGGAAPTGLMYKYDVIPTNQ